MSKHPPLPAHLFDPEQQASLQRLLGSLNAAQVQWVHGYLTGIQTASAQLLAFLPGNQGPAPSSPNTTKTTVLYGTKGGNSKQVAGNLHQQLKAAGVDADLQNMADFNLPDLKNIQRLLVIVSTHGEGDPPPQAEDFCTALKSRQAPSLSHLSFAVLALGDRSYASFCQTGKEVDTRLQELGAIRLLNRVDADVDFQDTAGQWITDLLPLLQTSTEKTSVAPPKGQITTPFDPGVQPTGKTLYTRKNPYPAQILDLVQLNGRGSRKKTFHLELSLGDSGIRYQPGDTAGLFIENDADLVALFIEKQQWTNEVEVPGTDLPLNAYLQQKISLTSLTGSTLEAYLTLGKEKKVDWIDQLSAILADKDSLQNFVYGRDLIDLIDEFPLPCTVAEAQTWLSPLQPRLYSIASSIDAYPGELHLTIGLVEYESRQRIRRGAASGYIAQQLRVGDTVNLFVESNESFRLPANPDTDIIMVGPGTGIAPFRAFVQARAAQGARGRNWLFFGDQHFSTDFLYQTEWQQHFKKKQLYKVNTAFSRDQSAKIYVQDRLQAEGNEIYQWLEKGAHLYVCGDARKMAKDLRKSLIRVVQEASGSDEQQAVQYVKNLVKTGRYQEDVY